MQTMRFDRSDLSGIDELDALLQHSDIADTQTQKYYISAYFDLLNNLSDLPYAIAVPYNCGTFIRTVQGKLIGIDLSLIENYYGYKDWEIPSSLYDLLTEKVDLLIVSHGHWDHCWIELMENMLHHGKTILVPEGFETDPGKSIPEGCIGMEDGEQYVWEGIQFNFRRSLHAYDNGRNIKMHTTTIWDGFNCILHTADADTTNPEGFFWHDALPVDVLLFKTGGVSPLVDDYDELERTIDLVNPRRLILPMHMSELGHLGMDAARPYGQAYRWLDEYRKKGRLGNRKYAVLFGDRIVNLSL